MKRTTTTERYREQDATRIYLKEVSANPLLTHAQEIQLSQQIEQARKQIVLDLFKVPQAVDHMAQQLRDMISGTRNMQQAFVLENNQDMLPTLTQILALIDQLKDPQAPENLATQVATQLSELPISLAFWDELIQPLDQLARKMLKMQGELMRVALSKGVTREQFMQWLTGDTPNTAKWIKFTQDHADLIQAHAQQLNQLAAPTGLAVPQLNAVVHRLRASQRDKQQAVDTMLRSNLRLVVSVAKRYTQVTSTPLLDLVQEGNLGLMRAIEKFNWRLGFRFSTYATWWIKQCVLKAVNEQHRIIRIPSHMTDLAKKVIQAREEYVSTVGYEPSVDEIAQMLDQDVDQVARVYTVAQGTISLETPVGTEEDQSLGNLIEDVDQVSPFEHIASRDTQRAVAEILSELTPKEERVIRMRFGIGVDQEATLEDVGNVMGVTRERIRQIEHKALEKLKQPLTSGRMQNAFD
jgi:RNA polymerase primary sigma factor